MAALQALYEGDLTRHDPLVVLERRIEGTSLAAPAEAFARNLVGGVLENREEFDKIISELAPSWPIDQMSPVDKNILRIAIYEMTAGGATPAKVAINEAVELAKAFGSGSSPRFVNGVLGSVMATAER